MKQVLILLGKARSGKDTVADFLEEKFGFKKFVFSSVLEEELKKQGKEVSKQNMASLGDELRKKFGMAVMAEKILKKVKEEEKIVFVGPRSLEEVELIKEKFPQAKVLLITAPEEKRFERRTEIDPQQEKDFHLRDKADEEKKGMKKIFVLADFKIENNSSLEDLFAKISDLMYNIFKEKRQII